MSVDEAVVPDSGAYARESGTTASKQKKLRRSLRRLESTFAVTPFVIYAFLGLGVPALVVIFQAFHGNAGGWTLSNMRLLLSGKSNKTTGGVYLVGFENSFKLGLLSALIPGIMGVFVAYAIQTSKNTFFRRLTSTASGVLANFGGINLTFMFIATLGSTGVLTAWLHDIGVNLASVGFNLYTFSGVVVVYMYFQLPLMVLVITPALGGLRQSWREAAENMGASSWRYWIHVGIPVLMPSILGGMLLLFGSAFAAYATAETLTLGLIALAPIQIGNFLNGNVIAGQTHMGYAIAFGMLVILAVIMTLYTLVRRRASKWLR
jgi:putative spermidine/putrescine transport system permease protein